MNDNKNDENKKEESSSLFGGSTLPFNASGEQVGVPSLFGSSVATKKDATVAKNKIKESIKQIELEGYKIEVDEIDLSSAYQIVIKINKD